MAKLTKSSVFKDLAPRSETPLDKTTRIVKKMVDDEAAQRHAKNTRLRKARLEREAHTTAETKSVARKKPPSKAAPKK